MNNKIINVYYGVDCLPYKDNAREVHYPIVGGVFLGASDTTVVRFYYDYIGSTSTTWVAETKLPNGKTGIQVLSKNESEDGHYAEISLSEWYTQAKGDIYISLKGYAGGVNVQYDDELDIYEVVGTPTIQATGAVKLSVNYTPLGVPSNYDDTFEHYQELLAALGGKVDIDSAIYVKVIEQGQTDFPLSEYNDGDLVIEKGGNVLYKLVLYGGVLYLGGTGLTTGSIKIYEDSADPTESVSITYSETTGTDIQNRSDQSHYRLLNENIYIIGQGGVTDTFTKNSYLSANYYNKDQIDEIVSDTFNMTSSPMELTSGQYNQLANNPNKVIKYNSGYYVLVSETESAYTYKKVLNVSNSSGVVSFVSDYITLNKTLKTLTSSSDTYSVYSYDKANDTFYNKTYIDNNYLTATQVRTLIEGVKANAFEVIETLPVEGKEGIVYLVAIDQTDLTKGYTQYIWEGSSYINIGTTQIDLSNYYTKSETYSKTEANNLFVPKTTTVAGISLSGNVSASAIQSALFDITVVEVTERD